MLIFRKWALGLVVLLGTASAAVGQAQWHDTLSPAQQLADWQVFRAALEHAHGGLYWHMDSTRWDSVEAWMVQNQRARSVTDFSLIIRRELTAIRCGHTGMRNPIGWDDYISQEPLLFPFSLHFQGTDRAFIWRDYTEDHSLPLGAEVTHINGLSMAHIYQVLAQYVTADGYSQGGVAFRIPWFYVPLFAQQFHTRQYYLTYQYQGTEHNVTVPAITRPQRIQRYQQRYESDTEEPLVQLTVKETPGGRVGHLVVRTFDSDQARRHKVRLSQAFRQAFQEIEAQDLDRLVLDLRGNGGGDDDLGALLCRYLIPEPFRYFDAMVTRTRQFGRTPGLVHANGLRILQGLMVKNRQQPGTYRWLWSSGLYTRQPKQPGYQGKLVVLMDGGTYSTASDVVAALHANRPLTLVGQETGGAYHGNTSASSVTVALPESSLRIIIPVVRYTSAARHPEWQGRGALPDVPVLNTIEDILAHRDRMLEVALQECLKQ